MTSKQIPNVYAWKFMGIVILFCASLFLVGCGTDDDIRYGFEKNEGREEQIEKPHRVPPGRDRNLTLPDSGSVEKNSKDSQNNSEEKTQSTAQVDPKKTASSDSSATSEKSVNEEAKKPKSMEGLDKNDIIEVGDKLSLNVVEDRSNPVVLFVDEEGMVSVPYEGRMKAAGKSPYTFAYEVKKALEKEYYHQATVLISDYTQHGDRGKVFLLGQVNQQGSMEIPTDEIFTVSKAIFAAGGFGDNADSTRVSLVRKDPKNPDEDVKKVINVGQMLSTGNMDDDERVLAGDLIFVPNRGASVGEILVTGAVRQPGPYPIPLGQKYTVSQAIFRAGGFDEFANESKVKVIRQDPSAEGGKIIQVVNVEKVLEEGRRDLDVQLKSDDVIVVSERWFNF